MKVRTYLKNGCYYDSNIAVTTKMAPHFTLKELANNKGNVAKPQFILDYRVDTFLQMLEEFRTWYNKSMKINSCYRQEEFNKSVGGNSKSAHLHACAVDWYVANQKDTERIKIKNKWEDICEDHKVIGSIIYYTNGYHLEAFSDEWYGSNRFIAYDYRKTSSDW